MFKVTTQFTNFKFNSIPPQKGIITVDWYVLKESDDLSEEEGRCFTEEESSQFLDFALKHTFNFPPNNKQRFQCQADDAPITTQHNSPLS